MALNSFAARSFLARTFRSWIGSVTPRPAVKRIFIGSETIAFQPAAVFSGAFAAMQSGVLAFDTKSSSTEFAAMGALTANSEFEQAAQNAAFPNQQASSSASGDKQTTATVSFKSGKST